jgi:hypothetical protein
MSGLTEGQQWSKGELRLWIDNEETLYPQRRDILRNLLRKVDKGVYDHDKAPKLWRYLVDRGAREYCQSLGGTLRSSFPKVVRDAVAQDYADEFIDDIDNAREESNGTH